MDETEFIGTPTPLAQPQAWSTDEVVGTGMTYANEPPGVEYQSRIRQALKVILPAVACTLVGAISTFWITTANFHPAEAHPVAAVIRQVAAPSPQDQYMTELAEQGIQVPEKGYQYRFVQYGMQACFNLTPPDVQSRTDVANTILSILATDAQNPTNLWHPPASTGTAQSIIAAAVKVYCPDV